MIILKQMKIINIEFEGVDSKDYPDFCDAFIAYAEHEDGTPLTEDELDSVDMGDYWDEIYQSLI